MRLPSTWSGSAIAGLAAVDQILPVVGTAVKQVIENDQTSDSPRVQRALSSYSVIAFSSTSLVSE